MSRSGICIAIGFAALIGLLFVLSAPSQGPTGIGSLASQADIVSRSITIFPDGTGLPKGESTARKGRKIYESRCAPCHGARGEGSPDFPQLAGGVGSLKSKNPVPTVGSYWPYATTLWDYNRRAMPYFNPGSLNTDEIYSVTAFILYLNGIIGEDDVVNEITLPKINMPNRDGFIPDPRPNSR